MTKHIKICYLFLSILSILLLCSCSSKEPWIGEWKPSSGDDLGSFFLTSNGVAVYQQISSGATLQVYGVWEVEPFEERTIVINMESSTIEIDASNNLEKQLLQLFCAEMCREPIYLTFSDNYKSAYADESNTKGFKKVSGSTGKFKKLTPEDFMPDIAALEDDAVISLYEIFYIDDMMYDRNEYATYTPEMKEKLVKLDIRSSVSEPFSASFKRLRQRVEKAEMDADCVIIDHDLLWDTQDGVLDFDLEILDSEYIGKNHAVVKAIVHNTGSTYNREYYMVRERSGWKIYDIKTDNESLRVRLEKEIKDAEEYIKKYPQ